MVNQKTKSLQFSNIANIVAKANAINCDDMIRLEVGDIEVDAPPQLKECLLNSLGRNKTHYPAVRGNPELIESVVGLLEREAIKATPAEILITSGGAMGLYLICASLLNSGDEVILLTPNWPHINEVIKFCEGESIMVGPLENLHIDFNAVRAAISHRTKLILITSPNNPSGVIYSRDELRELVEICKQHDLFLVSDEEYCDFVYDKHSHASPLNLYGKCFITRSFSKKYSITGLRLGYIVGDASSVQEMVKLSLFTSMYASSLVQDALAEYIRLDDNYDLELRQIFQEKVDGAMKILETSKVLKARKPEGGLYIWLDIRGTGKSDSQVADELLNSLHIATVPGRSFGLGGEGHLRLSLGTKKEYIFLALKKMVSFYG